MNWRRAVCLLICLAAVLAAGCGGGGGGGSSPSVTIDRTTVAVSASVTDSTVSTPTVTLTVSNAPSSGLYLAGASSNNGISTLSPGNLSGSMAVVEIFLKTPYTLAPAAYTDTVTLKVCLDAGCTQQIAGSPLTVTVTYTINPAPAGSVPTMSISATSVSKQALPTDTVPPAGVTVAIVNAPTFPLTATVTSTTNGVASVSVDPPAPTWNTPPQAGFGVIINLKPPSQLAPGVYTDRVMVAVCLDAACVNELAGSPQTVTVTYQVGNSVPGSYTVSQVAVQAVDLAVDNQHSLLYAAVPASAPANARSVAIIDPATATVTSYVPMGFDPGKLAMSDDGSYLYVGENNGPHVVRLALPAMSVDATIVLANDAQGSVTWPIDIKVLPGSPKTIAVARDFQNDTLVQGDGVVIYDDVTARPNIAGLDAQGNVTNQIGYLAWGSNTETLYGSGRAELDILSVDSSGAQVTTSTRPGNVTRIKFVGGTLYADNGYFYDPGSLMQLGPLPAPNPAAVAADASLMRVYEITSTGDGTSFYVYDAGTLASHGSGTIMGVFLSNPSIGTALARWGSSGLAFMATDQQGVADAPNDQVVLVSGPFVTQ